MFSTLNKACQNIGRQLWRSNAILSSTRQTLHIKQFTTTKKESKDDNSNDNNNNNNNDSKDDSKDDNNNNKLENSNTETSNEDGSNNKSKSNRIFLASPSTITEREVYVESVTPASVVSELDRYIIGQSKAKRAVAVSLRNRWRRSQLEEHLRKEVMPMNILMIGPTGTGKTEIARRLAGLVDAPFVKVEATKYTEVGIVGSSAEECVKDLIEKSVKMEKSKRIEKLKDEIDEKVEKQILARIPGSTSDPDKFKKLLREGHFDNTKIEVASFRMDHTPNPIFPFNIGGSKGRGINIFNPQPRSNVSETDRKNDRVPISEAREIIREFELARSIDENDIRRTGVKRAEESGIIFLDEIDKLCDSGYRGDYKGVKGEGVQKELLGLIEGTSVQTDYGIVQTDHMLFVASGAFHQSNPSDLLPELQGRLPIRVELEALSENDFYQILTKTEANLILQQQALFASEGVDLQFTEDAIRTVARISRDLNENVDNIGARRLRAVLSKIVENLSFDAPDKRGEKVVINQEYVESELKDILKSEDLSKYIL